MAMRRERMRLGDLLIKQDVLTEENLKKALELQKGTGKKIIFQKVMRTAAVHMI